MQGSQLCSMCSANTTNLEDGSSSCPVPLLPGSNISYRYAVIVSFGIKLNGTALDDIAAKVSHIVHKRLLVVDKSLRYDERNVRA